MNLPSPGQQPKKTRHGAARTREQKFDIVSAIYNRPKDVPLTSGVTLPHGISLPTYYAWRQQFNSEAAPGEKPFPCEVKKRGARVPRAGVDNRRLDQRIATMRAVHALHEAGMTFGEACREHDVHHATYLRWRKTLKDAPGVDLDLPDLEMLTRKGRIVTPPKEREEAVEKVIKLMKEGMTRRAACARLGYHYSSITLWLKRLGRGGLGRHGGDPAARPTKRDVNNLFIAPKIPAGLEILQRIDAEIAKGATREAACDKHGISVMFYERLETMFRQKQQP